MLVYAVVDDALSPDFPLGDSLEVAASGATPAPRIRRDNAGLYLHPSRDDLANALTHLES